MLKIHTGRITYKGEDGLDITVKSANTLEGCLLAPKWEIVMGHKQGKLTDDEYTTTYLAMLRYRYAQNKDVFIELIQREEITLLCYCAAGQFCHRHIAASVLKKIADSVGIECEIAGER